MRRIGVALVGGIFVASFGCSSGTKTGTASTDPTTTPPLVTDPSGSTTGGSTTGGTTPAPTSTTPATAPDAGTPVGPALPQKPGSAGPQAPNGPARVCGAGEASFNIGGFQPAASTPQAFRSAWATESAATGVPGLALYLSKLDTGPVNLAIGSLHAVSPAEYAFDAPPLSARNIPVVLDAANSLHITVPTTYAGGTTSFGDNTGRRGFLFQQISLDATLGGSCETISGRVTLILPPRVGQQPFGGTTVGAALGAPTTDTSNSGTPDGWTLVLEGSSANIPVEAPR